MENVAKVWWSEGHGACRKLEPAEIRVVGDCWD